MLRSRPLRGALLVTLISQVSQGIFVVLFILFVARRLHGSPADIGLLRGVQAVGAIAGGLVLVAVARRYSPGTLTAWSAVAFGAVALVLWNAPLVSTSIPVYVALFIVAGAPGVVLGTGLISAVQTGTDDDSRGRVFGAFGLIGNVGQAAGMLAAGLLAAPLGLLSILDAQAVLYLAAGAIAAWSMTGHRARRPRRPALRRRPSLRWRSAPAPGRPQPGQSHAAGTAPRPAAAAGPPTSSG
jgi:MFS family permease